MRWNKLASPLFALLLFAGLSTTFWIHRVHVDRPELRKLILNADAFIYFYPAAVFLQNELRRGELPLWNPYQLAGQPFVALHTPGALYPPNLVLLSALSVEHALQVHVVLHLMLAGFFTWLLAARLGLEPIPRFVAAVGWMLSGPMLWSIYLPPFLSTQAWLPAILWALHGLLSQARARWALALALFLSLSFLGGHAQGFVYIVQLAAVFGLFGLFLATPRGARGRVLGLALLSAFIATGLVAPQLFPAFELVEEGTRSLDGLSLRTASKPWVAPFSLVHGLARWLPPELLANSGLAAWPPRGDSVGPGWWSVALPLLGLPLILLGPAARRQRAYWGLFLCCAILSGLFILGPYSPVFKLYHALPFGDVFRSPVRMSFLYLFLIAVLMAIGLQGLSDLLRRFRVKKPVPEALTLVLALLLCADVYAHTTLVLSHPSLASAGLRGHPDLIRYLRTRPGYDRVFLETVPFSNPFLVRKIGMMNELFAVPDYEPNLPRAYQRYFMVPDDPPWHGNLTTLENSGPPPTPVKLLDLMSVRYYAASQRSGYRLRSIAGRRPKLVAGQVKVFEREQALPRAYTVQQVIVEPDPWRAVSLLLQDSFNPRRVAVIDREPPPLEPSQGEPRPALIDSYQPQEVRLSAQCASSCLLVLTDLYYPGWEASVDGEPAEVFKVNALFRGVHLTAGRHEISYHYRPGSYHAGLGLFFITLIATAACATYLRLRRAGELPE